MVYWLEIRARLGYCFFSSVCTFALGYFMPVPLIYLLARPLLLLEVERSLSHSIFILTEVAEAFHITVESIILVSFYLLIPFFAYHFWLFLSPGCYYKERKNVNQFICFFFSSFFFFFFIHYFWFFPLFWKFFLTFQINAFPMSLFLQAKMRTYIETIFFILVPVSFFFALFSAFFAIYQKKSLWNIQYDVIGRCRKYIFLFSLLLSSFFSPPEIVNQLIFTCFFYFFVEVILFFFFVKKRSKIKRVVL